MSVGQMMRCDKCNQYKPDRCTCAKLSESTETPCCEPDDHDVTCQECEWKGKQSDCEIEMDSEGWEHPEYEVIVCPSCGSTGVEI